MIFRKRALIFCLLLSLTIGAIPARGSTMTPERMLEQLFTSESIDASWFAPSFLSQVPYEQMSEIVVQYQTMLGAYEGAEGSPPVFQLSFEQGYVTTQIVLDAAGRISGIFLGPPEPKANDLDDALTGFQELPGVVSLLVASNAGVLSSIEPEQPMAVGSTFKLAILAALKDQVEAGLLAWDDVIELNPNNSSLPSGMLQEWPAGSPVTLHTLASLMISISDNTATDTLIDVVGREQIEAYTALNRPLLTTREAFSLKDPANATLLEAYRQGDANERRAVLEELKTVPLPDVSIFLNGPVALDVEWFFSTQELVGLIAYVQELPLMAINPGVASPDAWQHIAFKGGSEPGVMNLTTALVGHSGMNYYVSVTWNHDEVLDEAQFVGLYSGLLRELARIDSGE